MMPDAITVLIVDDHAIVRQGVRALFETTPDLVVVGDAASGEEALRLAAQFAPDVVLMDLIMPGIDGIETTRRLKQLSPRTQILVLTSHDQDENIFPAIRAGALSYLLKDVDPEELAQAVRKAARGLAVLHPRVAARVVQELRGARRDQPNAFTALSERELEVLRLVANGISNPDIARQLCISETTVKSHVGNILAKLHVADRTQAAAFAWREGVIQR